MRKLAVALCLTATVLTAFGQGTLNFNNRVTIDGINAPVDFEGNRLTGPDYAGQLYVSAAGAGAYTAVGAVTAFQTNPVLAGYINGGEVVVAGIAPGTSVDVVLRAWATASGSTWEAASGNATGIFGESNVVTVGLGAVGSPPGPAANLIGLTSFTLTQVPEPSTVALGLLGLAALALRRRK
jgi:hypothetical protein